MNGLLLVNKEENYTSRDIVNIISKKLNIKKVGHTGTLDPMAKGVLVLCIGTSTKLVELIISDDKEYIAEVTLGIKTDTLDITGNIIEEKETFVTKEEITNVIRSMKGKYFQEVPIYSAIKVNGKKLYQYARNNEQVDIPKRLVEIKKIELISDINYIEKKVIFKIKCLVSKGTYIRSLVNDLAFKLNTIGVMSDLIRTKQGDFKIESCYSLNDIENGNYKLLSPLNYLEKYKKVNIDNELEFKIKNGQILENIYNEDIIIFVKDNQLLSIYKKYDKNHKLIKPWKMF